ncbi:MAG: penicillin-insensitive murein endopeptidase [Deltaproteobacteria bacterium]|nr:penicillin-insensitive murein endopeptidase [Deltaproteobacteria bacterium]
MSHRRLLLHARAIAVTGLLFMVFTGSVEAEPRTWVVRPGDALSVLAKRFDIDLDKLRRWNELDNDAIHVGQKLLLEPTKSIGSFSGEIYVVSKGDTLGRIASSYRVTLDQLLQWNPEVTPDRIVEGQKLRVGQGSRRIEYRIRSGETLALIAARNRVTIKELLKWNAGINPDRIRVDQRLVIFSKLPPSFSESVGAPNRGQLINGVKLPTHSAFVIRDRERAWGTEETIDNLIAAFSSVKKGDRKAPRVMVHDLSLRNGGTMFGHNSHQSGRDVDIAYYQRNCHQGICALKPVSPSDLDLKRQWRLLKYWLVRRQTEAIFIDYHLQKQLYQHARDQGATEEQLLMWFQYPRGRTFPLGVIRHYPKHDDHIHVRFACHKSDPQCQTFRPLLMQPFDRDSESAP